MVGDFEICDKWLGQAGPVALAMIPEYFLHCLFPVNDTTFYVLIS